MTASGIRFMDANQAQCDEVYNEDDGSHKAQKASMRKAHKKLLYSSSVLTSDIDSDVHQGRGTTQAQIREENEYVAAMKKRESGAAAFCDVEENLERSRCRREAARSDQHHCQDRVGRRGSKLKEAHTFLIPMQHIYSLLTSCLKKRRVGPIT